LMGVPAAGESARHAFLKEVGKLWLYNQLCHSVETEVALNHLGLLRYCGLDNKKVVDVVGVGLKYFDYRRRKIQEEECMGFKLENPEQYVIGYNVLRGIEVKVSRGDFRNGFACTGCNYNYLLTPMRLISPGIVPRGVGLIEYNRYKFSCEPLEVDEENPGRRPFKLLGLRVVKPAAYRPLPQSHIDHVLEQISRRRSASDQCSTYRSVAESMKDPDLLYIQLESMEGEEVSS
jgi:hypothetical protein